MSPKLFKKFLWGLIILGFLIILVSFFFVSPDWRPFGVWAGRIAIILLWITALPGILKRFKAQGFLKKTQMYLLPARRRLGILVFVFAFAHYLWVRVFGIILFGPPEFDQIPIFETFGLFAFFIFVLLFLTSNNTAVKTLKKNWQRLHYLIYVTLWLLILHTVLQPPYNFVLAGVGINLDNLIYFGLPTLVVACLQIGSWFYTWNQRRARKTALKNA